MAASQLSERAASGFAKAALYDQHRPSYPSDAVQALLEAAGVSGVDAASLIDLAAGTGKFTELLAARDEHYNIIAVEPHKEMREQLERKKLDKVTVVEGLSTAIPAGSECADAVFAAQAFHWFANAESLEEIHRVLKPVGVLGLIWNAEDYNTPLSYPTSSVWATKLRDYAFYLEEASDDREPRFRNDQWRKVFESQVSSTPITAALAGGTNSLFSLPLGEEIVKWQDWLDQEALWNRLRTLSHFAVLEGRRLEVSREVFDEALSDPNVARDAEGRIKVDGVTVLAWTTKIP
ncbi:methyltransferase [Byssothecium circinans]|uniref:Methyltransferase n=1 Tax=Byssothecium circinans TaxID=147558 RepID=A0A6A5TA89_9PLEO|nr:methyltransferase [Byssothecium circinans]